MNTLLEGVRVGMMVAMPVGPTVILLLRVGLLRGLGPFAISSLGAACGVGVACSIALTCVGYIQSFVQKHAVATHACLALMVLAVCVHTFYKNKPLTMEALKNQDAQVSLWVPPVMSLTCPFTSILILNLLGSCHIFSRSLQVGEMAVTVLGTVLGAFFGYGILMTAVYFLSRTVSDKFIFLLVKLSPLILLYYGLQGLWVAYKLA